MVEQTVQTKNGARHRRVVLVEDDADTLDAMSLLLTRILERRGHRVSTASNGRDALQKLLTGQHDVMILDVRMPQLDGVGLLEVLRAYLRWYGLPVIVLSAHATPTQLERVKELGVIYVFHKASFRLDDLAAAVEDATGGSGKPEAPVA